jgi:hypothetical protein
MTKVFSDEKLVRLVRDTKKHIFVNFTKVMDGSSSRQKLDINLRETHFCFLTYK